MLLALVACASLFPFYAPPQPWARSIADAHRIPLVGDVDHDGYADLVAVTSSGDGAVIVSFNLAGQKPRDPLQAIGAWGKDCQAAAIGEFDEVPGADVVGVFNGQILRLAGSYAAGKLKDTPDWVVLPKPLKAPGVATVGSGVALLVFSTTTGSAYRVDTKSKSVTVCRVPEGTVWVGDAGAKLVGKDDKGDLFWLDPTTLKKGGVLGTEPTTCRPAAAAGCVAFADRVWTTDGVLKLTPSKLPAADVERAYGDFDHDGDLDLVEYRFGHERFTGDQVMLYRMVTPKETDSDADGLTNDEEETLGTDPLDPDTDNDGLLDGWEVKGVRGLDLKGMGCDPRHIDLVCLVSRFENVKEEPFKAGMNRAVKFYEDLKTPNPDGQTGFRLHPVYLDPIKGDDMKNGWPANRYRYRPAKWHGIVHWMQVTPGGGGQADQLGDGGSVAEGALWAVFVHEFGHQMGLDHEGYWPNNLCPIYTSLMNYAYSYALNDSINNIHYSDGSFDGFVLKETDLDETLPFPYDKVKFLEKGPYRFRLRKNGDTTLIDWNWNGVFGEQHVRADINYSYSTNAGRRDSVGKTQTSPWLFTGRDHAFLLYGTHDKPVDKATDPTVGPDKPGKVWLRRLKKPFEWEEPVVVADSGLIGDPVAATLGDESFVFFQTPKGVEARRFKADQWPPAFRPAALVDPDPTLVPTVSVYAKRLYVFLTDPVTGLVKYSVLDADGRTVRRSYLEETSTNPVGMCEDTITGEAIVGMAQNQSGNRPNRWQVRRYRNDNGKLVPVSVDWVDGEKGGSRGSGRITVLFDASRDAGPNGRVYFFCKGTTTKASPFACTYVAHQVADKTVNGGWMVKRFYDEWTQTRSAPAAAWFGNDVIWAYRWADGSQGDSDNVLHVGYHALGIQDAPMSDFDDLTFLRTWGIRNSLMFLSPE